MNLNEVQNAVSAANNTLRDADRVASQMAGMLSGRLRHVSPWALAELKRELRDFNMHTKEWMR